MGVSVFANLWRAVLAVVDAGFVAFRFTRRHVRLVDHASSAWTWLDDCRGARLAAYMSYFGLLSLFPILALVLGGITLLSAQFPGVGERAHSLVLEGLNSFLPGISESSFQTGATARIGYLQSHGLVTVLIGIGVLVFTGSGWISAQREAIRTVFETGAKYDRFFLIAKAHDIWVLLRLGLILAVSVAITAFGSTRTEALTRAVGMGGSRVANLTVDLAVALIGVVTGTVLFLAQHRALSGLSGRPARDFLSGAVVAALGFEILKQLATFIITRTLHNGFYGAFTITAAVLIWINFTSRVSLYGAAWTVTRWRAQEAARAAAAAAAADPSRARRPATA